MQFLCNFAGKHNFSNDDFWFKFMVFELRLYVYFDWSDWMRGEGWWGGGTRRPFMKIIFRKKRIICSISWYGASGDFTRFFSSSSLLPPSSALTRVVVRPCFSSLSISTPRLNREKSFTLSIPKVLWESSNLEPINRKKQSGILNPDLLDPGEYVMEKVDT